MPSALFLVFLGAYLLYNLSLQASKTDMMRYVARLTFSVIEYGKRQAEFCSSFANEIVNKPWEIPLLRIEANSDLKRLAERLDQQTFYHAFLSKYGRSEISYKHFSEYYARIDFIDLTVEDLKHVLEKVQLAIWERKKAYAETFTNIKMLMERLILNDEYLQNVNLNHIPNRLSNLLESFYDANPNNEENFHETYVYVIWQLRLFIVSNGQKTAELTELLQLSMHAINQYKGVVMSAELSANDFKTYGSSIKNAVEELENVSVIVRNDFGERSKRHGGSKADENGSCAVSAYP